MRWPFGPPHLTLKPSKKKTTTKNRKTKQKKGKNKNQSTKLNKKEAFQLSVKFFLADVQNFPFWQLGPKNAHPKNTIKIGVSARFFWKAAMRHKTAIFGPKKPKTRSSSYHFFAFFFSFNNKNHNNWLKPHFYSGLANQQKRVFKN